MVIHKFKGYFKAVIADKSDFPSKQYYERKAKAELGKVQEQRSRQGTLRVPLKKTDSTQRR